jgi:hypothetical protein
MYYTFTRFIFKVFIFSLSRPLGNQSRFHEVKWIEKSSSNRTVKESFRYRKFRSKNMFFLLLEGHCINGIFFA